jgi:tetratricopeptide (TPR) repeat protein
MMRAWWLGLTGLCFLFLLGATCMNNQGAITKQPLGEGKDLYAQADAKFAAGDYEGARETYQQVIDRYPGSGFAKKAAFQIGLCYSQSGQDDKALEQFKRYLSDNSETSDPFLAQGYIIALEERQLQKFKTEQAGEAATCKEKLAKQEQANKSLRKAVDGDEVYLEMDLEHNKLYVKMGTQALYEYPIVSGKGATTMRLTGNVKDFDTPRGVRKIIRIEKDPVWVRPDWYWTEKGMTVPPNLTQEERAVPGALGPYKLSFGEGYYIHGTRTGTIDPGKFSHGCVRMNNKDLLKIVSLVKEGTMLFIY